MFEIYWESNEKYIHSSPLDESLEELEDISVHSVPVCFECVRLEHDRDVLPPDLKLGFASQFEYCMCCDPEEFGDEGNVCRFPILGCRGRTLLDRNDVI